MTGRDVDVILADLGDRLAAAAEVPPRRTRRLARRTVVGMLVSSLTFGSTALATRSVWAPAAPGPDVVGGLTVRVASTATVGLAAQRCTDETVATFLRIGGGGAGRGCDARPAPIGTYYDPATQRTYVFGLLGATGSTAMIGLRGTPASSSVPQVAELTAALEPADPLAVTRGHLPSGSVVLLAQRAGAWTVATVVIYDRSHRTVLRCQEARCTTD